MSVVTYGLILALVAGLATAVGGLLSVVANRPGGKFVALTLGFSAGAMILVSFEELLGAGVESHGFVLGHLAFFAGMLIMFLIDVLIPHDYISEKTAKGYGVERGRLRRAGILVALGVAIHNFPEGIATFAATLHDPQLGLALAITITIHNIPEGLAISTPILAATGSKKQALLYSLLAGLAEPVGAVLAALFLLPFVGESLGLVLAAVGGVMVFISLHELVPISRSYGEERVSIVGIILGMAVMAGTLHILG